jgi:hypothetical protein
MSRKLENSAKPTRKAAALVAATTRSRSTPSSTSGCSRVASIRSQTASRTSPPASRPSVRVEPQPQASPSVTASRTATSASESTTAPSQSTRARSTGGEGGTSRCTANATGSEMRLIQNSQLTSKLSTTTPASGRPMPAPMPNDALSSPIPAANLGRGKVSRITPKASGNTPPAMPWIARPAMTTPIDVASAHTTEPSAKASITPVSTRPLPNRSPSLPTIGVATEAESRNAVSTQDADAGLACVSRANSGSAGMTSVWARANEMAARTSTARTWPGRLAGVGVFEMLISSSGGSQLMLRASRRIAMAWAIAARVACVSLSGLSIRKSCVMPS